MEIKVEGSRRNKKFVEMLLPSMLDQLNLQNCRKAMLIRIADECSTNSGITLDLTAVTGSFLVVIKPNRNLFSIGRTLAHELVHVQQMASGRLKVYKNVTYWSGKKFINTPYLDSPWEISAFAKQELIFRRALENQ